MLCRTLLGEPRAEEEPGGRQRGPGANTGSALFFSFFFGKGGCVVENYLERYYRDYDEDGRLESRWGQVEYLTTLDCIHRYLRPGMRVLEIGAATGRYSHALAREGYQVDAVELLAHHVAQFRERTRPGERVTIVQGDARDLSAFAPDAYDVTLLLGPMYHLYTRKDQLRALGEALRVTRPGGVVCAAYCMSDPSVLSYGFRRGCLPQLLERGLLDLNTFAAFSDPEDLFELYRVEDIAELRGHFPVTPLELVATDGYANHMRDTLEEMDEETYRWYLRYHLATCRRQDMIGYSHHTLDIFRKDAIPC